MKTTKTIILAAALAAMFPAARADEPSDRIARMEARLAELEGRVAAIEGKATAAKAEDEDKPDPEVTGKGLAEFASSQSEGAIQAEAFEKLDGTPARESGVRLYAMKCQMDIRFTVACVWLGILGERNQMTFKVARPPSGKRGQGDAYLFDMVNPGVRAARGARYRITGTVSFRKSEGGWGVESFVSDSIKEL
jgi:hypothetical protein